MSFLDRFRRKYRRIEDPTGIDLRHDGGIELGCSFDREVGWDDAMFNVAIEGWTPRPVSLDD